MVSLKFSIRGLPATANQVMGRNVWTARSNTAKWKELVRNAVHKAAHAPGFTALTKCRLTLTRYGTQFLDYDGLVISFKPVVDGLCHAHFAPPGKRRPSKNEPILWHGIIADDNWLATGAWDVHQQKVKRGEERIEILVEDEEAYQQRQREK